LQEVSASSGYFIPEFSQTVQMLGWSRTYRCRVGTSCCFPSLRFWHHTYAPLGRWHDEVSAGDDRPDTDVEG
jgi:hypothetical protein